MKLFKLNSHVKKLILLCKATKHLKCDGFKKKYHLHYYSFVVIIEICLNISG